jgi:acetoin utilization deacetylase AcuC-like enzyme
MRLYYCDHHEIPLPAGHKFPIAKYAMLRALLESDGRFTLQPAQPADPAIIKLAHDPDYVDQFINCALPPAVMRRIGFPWSEGLVRRTLASAGGTLAATRDALESGIGGTLAGGTHHAFRSEGSGFCVFNDVAIAIHHVRATNQTARVAVVDLDVHQGDGTAAFFENDAHVLTLSMHGAHNFPFRKQRSKIDVELSDKTGDQEYLAALDHALPRVWEFEPEIVFYLSGVDPLASDVLGRLALTEEGLKVRDRRVIEAVHSRSIPLVITLGGGYSNPIELTAEAHANTFRIAAELYSCSFVFIRGFLEFSAKKVFKLDKNSGLPNAVR